MRELVIVPGAGHMIQLEAPEAVNDAIAALARNAAGVQLISTHQPPSRRGTAMSDQTLQQKLDQVGDVVEFLRNQQVGPNVYPGVPAEYSNWRNEQRAWAKSAVLFNQSYHMVELYVRGPDAFDAARVPRDQQLQELHGQQGQAVRAGDARTAT